MIFYFTDKKYAKMCKVSAYSVKQFSDMKITVCVPEDDFEHVKTVFGDFDAKIISLGKIDKFKHKGDAEFDCSKLAYKMKILEEFSTDEWNVFMDSDTIWVRDFSKELSERLSKIEKKEYNICGVKDQCTLVFLRYQNWLQYSDKKYINAGFMPFRGNFKGLTDKFINYCKETFVTYPEQDFISDVLRNIDYMPFYMNAYSPFHVLNCENPGMIHFASWKPEPLSEENVKDFKQKYLLCVTNNGQCEKYVEMFKEIYEKLFGENDA